jgi:putative spermidine/putrescine transport system ATP-binding protein
MRSELRRWQKELGLTFIHVTHSQEEAMALADTIVVMSRGRIEQSGSPGEVFNKPVSEFVARFMGGHNILDTPGGRIAVRSDRMHVIAANEVTGLPATLVDMEYQGSYGLLSLDVPQASKTPLSVMLPEASYVGRSFTLGQPYRVAWSEQDVHPLPEAVV